MKKKIALLISVLLLLASVFAACNQTTPTNKVSRWDAGESYTFNVTLADFETELSTTFKAYPVTVKDKDGIETAAICYKDSVVQSTSSVSPAGGGDSESLLFSSADEICPLAVSGTFTMTISSDSTDRKKLETTQIIYSQYDTEKLRNLNCLDKLASRIATAEENPFENNSGRTTLRSKTTAVVVFSDADQTPVSSVKENEGYYIGKVQQCLSQYKIETTYNFDKSTVTVKENDGEEKTLKLGIRGTCIDSAQLLLYIRSLDKTSTGFQDSPSVNIYDPATGSTASASFALNREFNALLSDNGIDVGTKVHAVSVSVNGRPFMTQYNLPDLTKAGQDESGLDFRPMGADGKSCKFTTIKFRSGWYSYELSQYDPQVIDAIKLSK